MSVDTYEEKTVIIPYSRLRVYRPRDEHPIIDAKGYFAARTMFDGCVIISRSQTREYDVNIADDVVLAKDFEILLESTKEPEVKDEDQ